MTVTTATFAFDRQSARSFDADGRMRVRDCIISVAEINPYYGREIPNAQALQLAPNRVYDLYRDPGALSAAADSFNGLPLMIRHVAQTADEPRKEYQAGSVYNTRFEDGKLRADLLVSDAKAIQYIESGELADLSSSYRYTPDMTPGEVDGRKYDGRMIDIAGNHVALVEDGRATGAHVADSALLFQPGASTVDPTDNTQPNDTPDVAQALLLLTQKLADIESRLAAVETKDTTPALELTDTDEDGEAEIVATDEDGEAKRGDKDDDKDKPPVAMDAKSVRAVVDAAVKAERARADAVARAKQATRVVLGDMIAMDSASDIYRAALKERGVDVSAIPAGAEQAAWTAIQSVAAPRREAALANDSKAAGKPAFDLSHIRIKG